MFTQSSFYKTVLVAFCISIPLGISCHLSAQAQDSTEGTVLSIDSVSETDTLEAGGMPTEEAGSLDSEAVEDIQELDAQELGTEYPEIVEDLEESEEPEVVEDPEAVEDSESAVESTTNQDETSEVDEIEIQQVDAEDDSYQTLEAALTAGEWRVADNETFNLMLSLVGEQSEQQGYFSLAEWNAFVGDEAKCESVKRIDELWKAASDGDLGFSAQKRIYEEDYNTGLFNSRISSFYFKIGWLRPERTVAWVRNTDESVPADDVISYVDGQEPVFEDPIIPGHLPAAMYWEEDADGNSLDRRLYLFHKCNL